MHEPSALRAQASRMLTDDRSRSFIDGLLDGWLGLRELGASPPDRRLFPEYYRYDLGKSMRTETRMFARHVLEQNLDVGVFLDSDFAFVDRPLAKLYGLPDPLEPGFHRVRLDDDRRGGLLGQASVLTVTANGVDTSPVTRGVWVLDHILGTPPSPPPPNVKPLDPDVRGAQTIRDQLRKHRDAPNCATCHRKIDPLGFALENYDAIGKWRTHYKQDTPVDASGELPDGQRFADIGGLRQLLWKRRVDFARALAGKVLEYSLGRPLTAAGRPDVDAIVAEATRQGHGFRDLVLAVVQSDAFARP